MARRSDAMHPLSHSSFFHLLPILRYLYRYPNNLGSQVHFEPPENQGCARTNPRYRTFSGCLQNHPRRKTKRKEDVRQRGMPLTTLLHSKKRIQLLRERSLLSREKQFYKNPSTLPSRNPTRTTTSTRRMTPTRGHLDSTQESVWQGLPSRRIPRLFEIAQVRQRRRRTPTPMSYLILPRKETSTWRRTTTNTCRHRLSGPMLPRKGTST